jgi:hypothetical protein
MNRREIADSIRTEAAELEALIKKLQARCEHMKWLANALDSVQLVEKGERPFPKSKFWDLIDKVFGNKK